jgi:pimeloyl-ACP methyl ester carboxylesterase
MATFVLVHGAMHGGWCWQDVSARLRGAGHTVHTPTLTGQGDRRHQLTRDVGVSNHVDDLTELLWFEDLHDVYLGLHSYSGVLAGPVVEHCHERIAVVLYLAAFLVHPGECLLDVEPPETATRYQQLATSQGDGYRIPATDAFLDQWGVTDAAARAWVGPRLTDFPLKCATDVVTYDEAALAATRQVYVRHTDPPLGNLDVSWSRAVDARWETHDLACGHDLMLAAPDETAALLGELSA